MEPKGSVELFLQYYGLVEAARETPDPNAGYRVDMIPLRWTFNKSARVHAIVSGSPEVGFKLKLRSEPSGHRAQKKPRTDDFDPGSTTSGAPASGSGGGGALPAPPLPPPPDPHDDDLDDIDEEAEQCAAVMLERMEGGGGGEFEDRFAEWVAEDALLAEDDFETRVADAVISQIGLDGGELASELSSILHDLEIADVAGSIVDPDEALKEAAVAFELLGNRTAKIAKHMVPVQQVYARTG
jgi:hypothetical protein